MLVLVMHENGKVTSFSLYTSSTSAVGTTEYLEIKISHIFCFVLALFTSLRLCFHIYSLGAYGVIFIKIQQQGATEIITAHVR